MNMKQTLNDWLPALLKEAELGNRDAMGIWLDVSRGVRCREGRIKSEALL